MLYARRDLSIDPTNQDTTLARASRSKCDQGRHRARVTDHALRTYALLLELLFCLFELWLAQHPAMTRLISKLKLSSSPNTTLFCLSNANSVYIKTILEVRMGKNQSIHKSIL